MTHAACVHRLSSLKCVGAKVVQWLSPVLGLLLLLSTVSATALTRCALRRQWWVMNTKLEMRPQEFRNLRPLPCLGNFRPTDIGQETAIFLGPEQMLVQQREDGKCIARGLMPIPVRDDVAPALLSACKADERMAVYKSWSGQLITDRNNALYDNMQRFLTDIGRASARREIYEALRLKGSCESPYHGIVQSLERFGGVTIRGLIIEVADKQSQNSFSLGATALMVRTEAAPRWRLTAGNLKAMTAVRSSTDAALVKCAMDELLGLALATDLPIVVGSNVYEGAAVDGLLEQLESSDKTMITAPYFATAAEAKLWKAEQERLNQETARTEQRAQRMVPKAHEIRDASGFLTLRPAEKRAILRATGVRELPRPREGVRALDALLIPLLDEEVAYEVLRRLAETKGNYALAAQMNDFESRKPFLARQIREAQRAGDAERARMLCDELNSLSVLKFDPTNADGKGGEWDVEEWYWEQRKRVYGIIAA